MQAALIERRLQAALISNIDIDIDSDIDVDIDIGNNSSDNKYIIIIAPLIGAACKRRSIKGRLQAPPTRGACKRPFKAPLASGASGVK